MRRWIAIAVLLAMTMTLCACGMSAEKQAEMERETLDMLKDVNVGDEVRFGVYDGEPIEWVVAVKMEGLYLLVASDEVTKRPYNDEPGSWESKKDSYHYNEWSYCSLRGWLNGDFYERAFGDAAKEAIVTCHVINDVKEAYSKHGGEDTYDKVFILSYGETAKYMGPLGRAKLEKSTTYWLRVPVGTNGLSALCYSDALAGGFNSEDLNVVGSGKRVEEADGVRPAIWVTDRGLLDVEIYADPATEEGKHGLSTSVLEDLYGATAPTGTNRCILCNGTGWAVSYYGESAMEAYVNGQPDYSFIKCPMCKGTGYTD